MRKALILAASLMSAFQATAATIVYEGTLSNGVTVTNSVTPGQYIFSGNLDFWNFYGNQGDTVTITGRRLESGLDPAFYVYEGIASDTDHLGNVLAFGDDNLGPNFPGPFGDPEVTFSLTLPGTGGYTIGLGSYASNGDTGSDGVYSYNLTARGIQNHVPDSASTLGLLSLGLFGLAALRRKVRA